VAATIFVDQNLCTKCGICSTVCPAGIVIPGDENAIPTIPPSDEGRCIRCGHCEVCCPAEALTLNFRPEEKIPLSADAGTLSASELGAYLKRRRSVRHFTREPVPRDLITRILEIAQ
jgi:formate hydrogenlyase subunit 6/NADH:ubiquinone oxidoreductase subunit I